MGNVRIKKGNIFLLLCCCVSTSLMASKLMEVKVIDQNIIHLYFKDGEATFVDDGNGACPHDHCEDLANNDYVPFGNPLNTANAQNNGNYSISSSDDANFSSGVNPTSIYRKSKMANMVWRAWTGSDYSYDWGLEHQVFLSLPQGLEHGKTYTIAINDKITVIWECCRDSIE